MAELVNYDNADVEASLVATSTSHGLMSSSDKKTLDELNNMKNQLGGAISYDVDEKQLIYKYRVYSIGSNIQNKIPFILFVTNNNSINLFSGIIWNNDKSLTNTSMEMYSIFGAPGYTISCTGKIIKYTISSSDTKDGYVDVQFIASAGIWSTSSLLVPGYKVEYIK